MMPFHPKRLPPIQILLWSFVLMACVSRSSEAQTTVYITRTGSKYHKGTCRYLRSSKITTTLASALENGYTACSVCEPGEEVTDKELADEEPQNEQRQPKAVPPTQAVAPAKPKPVQKQSQTVSAQCSSLTKAGTRCKRTTIYSNGRCWQHQ